MPQTNRPSRRILIGTAVLLVGAATAMWFHANKDPGTTDGDVDSASPTRTTSSPSRPRPVADVEAVPPGTRIPEPPAGKAWGPSLKAALAEIFALTNENERDRRLQAAADAVDLADAPAILSYLMAFDEDDLASNLVAELDNRILARWAEKNLKAASEWAATARDGTMREDAIQTVIRVSAAADVGEAEKWARAIPDEAGRAFALGALIEDRTAEHPSDALRLLKELPAEDANPKRDILINISAAGWAHDDPAAATEWARKLEDSPLKAQVISGIAITMAEKDPAAAAALAVTEMPAGQAQSDTVVSLVQRWALQDPEKAAAWVEQFPAGTMKSAATRTLVAAWTLKEPDKATAWGKTQSP
ncbi:hypothetical protein [Luteolibacter sp. LG18]|uniref:hypothetical protein n=1 Tax=Luteolibacter sp. LG18 TaxID=2819286 RepID=UPI002B2E7CC6|nr:hypothetical protein llg_02180 [Luteolibacter sp. LG18]